MQAEKSLPSFKKKKKTPPKNPHHTCNPGSLKLLNQKRKYLNSILFKDVRLDLLDQVTSLL